MMEADNEILRYAGELTEQINPGKPEPDTVTWDSSLPSDAVVVRYGEVKLPQAMQGKLRPEEWRPLLASSMAYYGNFSKEQTRGALFRLVIPIGLSEIPLIFALLYLFRNVKGDAYTTDLVLIIVIWALYANSMLWLYIHHFWRNRFYAADKRAAEIVGLSPLVQSLMKVRDTALALKIGRKRNPLFPSINQRIQKLNKMST